MTGAEIFMTTAVSNTAFCWGTKGSYCINLQPSHLLTGKQCSQTFKFLGHFAPAIFSWTFYFIRLLATKTPILLRISKFSNQHSTFRSLFQLAGSRDADFCRETSQTFSNLLSAGVAGIRMGGSCVAGIIRVAEGSSDILVVSGCHIWDVAAVCVILEESGGKLLNYNVPAEAVLTKRKFIATSTLELAELVAPLIAWSSLLEED